MDYIPKCKPKSGKKKRDTYFAMNYTISKPNEDNEKLFLGEIWFGKTNNIIPMNWDKCKACITLRDEKLILNFDSTIVVITLTTELQFLKDLLSTNVFNMKFKLDEENVIALLYLRNLPLPKFYAKIGSVIKTVFSIIFNISCEYNEIQSMKSSSVVESFTELYQNVNCYRDQPLQLNVQHSQLKPKLRQYQEEAVRWMIHREQKSANNEIMHPMYEEITLKSGAKIYFDKHTGFLDATKPMVNSLRTGGILADEMGLGKTVEVLSCILCHPQNDTERMRDNNSTALVPVIERQSRKRKKLLHKEEESSAPKKLNIPHDWVKPSSRKSDLRVALESWYNKVLSNSQYKTPVSRIHCICGDDVETDDFVECVDCSKIQHGRCLGYKSSYGSFCCSQCWNNRPLLESHATLIVTPQTLKKQWCDEICKHIRGNLKVFHYDRGTNLIPIYPTKLQKYDLVITTYNVLQQEFRLSDNGQVISLRRPPKYSQPGSPVTRINWWRLCLDEAQTVEIPGRMVSEMVKKIHAHHRWAVTGTPISKDISDLYGLIDYLQLSPYSDIDTWSNLLYKPYINGKKQPMHKFLSQILWRTSKREVINQINIPQQTVEKHWLDFTDVERFFYQREYELCSKEFLAKLQHMDLNILLCSLNRSVLEKILQPVLALRQVCVHHHAVKGKYLATRKEAGSMEDLLNALIAKNVNENEEYLRLVISSLNGLAGVYLLLQNPNQAVEEYRKVLQLSARFSNKNDDVYLVIDKLQLIHTMYNLSDVLETYPSLPPTLRDSSLKEECKALEKEYMERFTKPTVAALDDCIKLSNNITQLQEKFVLSPGQWFADILSWITTNSLLEEYIIKLTSIANNASVCLIDDISERKILYKITIWDEDITKLKEKTVNSIHELFVTTEDESIILIPTEIIEAATDCHLRPQHKSKKRKSMCPLCKANFNLKQYESKLFSSVQSDDDISNTGSWKPSSEEFMLRALHALCRQRRADEDFIHDADIHFQILDLLKKEFKEIRKLWTYLDAQVCAKDEVDMCKIRLRMKEKSNENESDNIKINRIVKQLANIEKSKLETIHMLDEHEIQYQQAVLYGQYKINSLHLEKNLGTYKYLQTLHKQQATGETPDPCPICKNKLEELWNVLPCGHSYCVQCIQTLLSQTSSRYISCSICRSQQLIADMYLHTDGFKVDDNPEPIKGNHSTKVAAIVRLVKKLKENEHDVKVLVFSNWLVILKVLKEVFHNNDITSEILRHYNFDKTLDRFKEKSNRITALLLPVNLGSKGLNLIEATHVIFVEPLLDPGDELQAIGRIHRIGQVRPTVIHKFFIKNTVEENIYHATEENAEEWDSTKVTLRQIKQLFETESSVISDIAVDAEIDLPQEDHSNVNS